MAVEKSLSFAALLRRHRRAAGQTQESLSERSGVSVHAISDLERGVYLAPHQSTVDLLAAALGLSSSQRGQFVEAARTGGPAKHSHEMAGDRAGDQWDEEHPLIGREAERRRIDQHLEGHGPPLLLLSGEP